MVIDQVLYPLSVAPLATVSQNEKCRKEGKKTDLSYKPLPSLLHIIQCDVFRVLQQEVTGPSVEYGVTRRTLHLLGHFVTQVLDHQLYNIIQ